MVVWLIAVIIGLVAVGGVAVVATQSFKRENERRRREGVEGLAARLGLEHREKADTAFRDAWAVLPEIKRSGEVRSVLFGAIGDAPVTVFRHRYVVSNGQSSSAVIHWVFSTDVPGWPGMRIRRRSWFAALVGGRGGAMDDAVFNRSWAVRATDGRFAAALLTPAVREALMRPVEAAWRRKRKTWHVVKGKLCLVVRGELGPEQVGEGLEELVTMLGLMSRSPAGTGATAVAQADASAL